jgi:hypothetical protein
VAVIRSAAVVIVNAHSNAASGSAKNGTDNAGHWATTETQRNETDHQGGRDD